MPELAELTTIVTWASAIRRALDLAGIDPVPVFSAAGLDIELLNDSDARYSVAGMTKLWQLGVEATGNQAFPMAVARQVQPNHLHGLGMSLISSETLGDAAQRLQRYSRLVSDAAVVELEVGAVEGYIEYQPAAEGLAPQAFEAFLAASVNLVRTIQPKAQVIRVELASPEPVNRQPYDDVFAVPLQFDAAAYRIYMHSADMTLAMPLGNDSLAQANDVVIRQYLDKFDASAAKQVRSAIIDLLLDGAPSLAMVAKKLATSVRSLQRHLDAEAVTFSELREQVRRELALNWVSKSDKSFTEIAYRLGYSDQSNFTKAFQRWVGKSPRQHRQSPSL